MIREIVSDFPFHRRCVSCDGILSASLIQKRPVAIRIRKRSTHGGNSWNIGVRGFSFECIRCATREFISNTTKKKITKTTLEQVYTFLKIKEIKIES